KQCGHLGDKVLVPTGEFITKLIAARLAAAVRGVDTLLIARTEANSAGLWTSDIHEYDRRPRTAARSPAGSAVLAARGGGPTTLAQDYRQRGMAAYADLQSREFAVEREGYEAVKHQEFVGVGYFDEITQVVHSGRSSTVALDGSTEKAQFVS